jgi:hypothetical protein
MVDLSTPLVNPPEPLWSCVPITISARKLIVVQYAPLKVFTGIVTAFSFNHEARPLAGRAYHIAVISSLASVGLKFITPTFGAR